MKKFEWGGWVKEGFSEEASLMPRKRTEQPGSQPWKGLVIWFRSCGCVCYPTKGNISKEVFIWLTVAAYNPWL